MMPVPPSVSSGRRDAVLRAIAAGNRRDDAADDLTFRPVTAADLPLLADWLERPHWREWWGDPADELPLIRTMVEGADTTLPYLAQLGPEPVGYIQVWFVGDNQTPEVADDAPWVMDLSPETVGVDLSLGDAGRLGQGLGSRILAAFAARLRQAGCTAIIIDPDPANLRAVRAYARAGFRPIPRFEGVTRDVLLMQHHAG